MARDVVLVTGFPGFIGTRLVAALAADRPKADFVCLVEPRMADAAAAAAEKVDPKRVSVVTGDIGERGLGLAGEDHDRLVEEMTQVFHLAAIYDLAVPLEVAQRVNVEGTGNVIELCARAKKLERHDYVSTAYVAGVRKGVVYEHELVLGQEFKNHYESTKFQAEAWVRESLDQVPTAIYRPAIVVGDSRTGETQKFDGPYYLLRTIARSVERGMPIVQFGRAAAPFNVVPVDFVVDALVKGGSDPKALGETFHLVDPTPVSAADLTGLLARGYAGQEPTMRVPSSLVENSLRIKKVRNYYSGAPRESIRYLNHPVRFDTRQAGDMLARNGLRCPRFEEYLGPIVDFFKAHETDPMFAPGVA